MAAQNERSLAIGRDIPERTTLAKDDIGIIVQFLAKDWLFYFSPQTPYLFAAKQPNSAIKDSAP